MTFQPGLTPRQAECHRFIFEHHRQTGDMPTLDEIRLEMGLSVKSSAHELVTRLVARGFIERTAHGDRNLRIIRKPALPNTMFFKVNDETLQLEEMNI